MQGYSEDHAQWLRKTASSIVIQAFMNPQSKLYRADVAKLLVCEDDGVKPEGGDAPQRGGRGRGRGGRGGRGGKGGRGRGGKGGRGRGSGGNEEKDGNKVDENNDDDDDDNEEEEPAMSEEENSEG